MSEPPLPLPPPLHRRQWEASLTRTSWAFWYVTLTDGIMTFSSGWFVVGTETRARRVAARILARQVKADRRRAATIVIRPGPQDAPLGRVEPPDRPR